MPLLSEFASYVDWEADARRWAMMLYNRPISMAVDYFVNNMNDNETSVIYKNAGGFSKHKSEAKVEENEKATIQWGNYDPVSYAWAFKVLRGKFRGPEGVPIFRIMWNLSGIDKVKYRELEPGVCRPEVAWDWVGKKRIDLKAMGGYLKIGKFIITLKIAVS